MLVPSRMRAQEPPLCEVRAPPQANGMITHQALRRPLDLIPQGVGPLQAEWPARYPESALPLA